MLREGGYAGFWLPQFGISLQEGPKMLYNQCKTPGTLATKNFVPVLPRPLPVMIDEAIKLYLMLPFSCPQHLEGKMRLPPHSR